MAEPRSVPRAQNRSSGSDRPVRDLADDYVAALAELVPTLATQLGTDPLTDRLPDFSPDGEQAVAELRRHTLRDLQAVATGPGAEQAATEQAAERRCAKLLGERLRSELAAFDSDEHLRSLSNLFSPVQAVRSVLLVMPDDGEQAWAAQVRRVERIPVAYEQYEQTLREGLRRGLTSGPAQVGAVIDQLGQWSQRAGGRGWFAEHLDQAPDGLAASAGAAAAHAQEAVLRLREFLTHEYGQAVASTPDAVGRDRYLIGARRWTGADLDPEDVYAWGWADLAAINARMVTTAQEVLPGASPVQAMAHLEAHGDHVDGEDAVRDWLQQMMDRVIAELDGSWFDIDPAIRTVEAKIAPPGSAAAPYYTRPSLDLTRPGRTWLPTLGRTRFPLWDLVSTWYHEGVPGHHMQLAQWALLSQELSRFQTSVGSVSASSEGWALYAERLMDELGYLRTPGERMGYLNAQALRAARVVVDVGMHLGLPVPEDQHGMEPFTPGECWDGPLAERFLARHTGLSPAFRSSEVVRYLGMPGQAISYKLGERAWLAGRETARTRARTRGEELDLRTWHMAALSAGSLGLDDLAVELGEIG